jgi:hypothetical protein
MIVNPEIQFRADVLPLRARKVRRTFAASTPNIRIRETTGAEAPIVLVDRFDIDPVDVRMFEGRLYAVHPFHRNPEIMAEGLAKVLIQGFVDDGHLDGKCVRATTDGREKPAVEGRNLDNQEDLVVSLAQKWSDDELLVVDGRLLVRARSPVLTMDDVENVYGYDAALRVVANRVVPAWMPSARMVLRETVLATPRTTDANKYQALMAKVSVDYVRPELLPTDVEAWTDLIDLKSVHGALLHRHWSPPKFHAGLTPKWGFDETRQRMMKSVFESICSDEASSGPDAVVARMRQVLRPLQGEAVDTHEIFDPSSRDWPRRPASVYIPTGVYEQWGPTVDRAKGEGWTLTGSGAKKVLVRIATLEASSISPVASGSGLSIAHGPYGFMVSAPMGRHAGQPAAYVDGAPTFTSGRLTETAWRTGAGWENGPKTGIDYLGLSLRRKGVLKAVDDRTRAGILDEFVEHRMVAVGDDFHLRCPEPLMAVWPADDPKSRPHAGLSLSWAVLVEPTRSPPYLFRIDRHDEAMSMARECGIVDPENVLDRVTVSDTSVLSVDTAMWNLRASLGRIVPKIDQRLRFFPVEAAEAVGRLLMHLETWFVDPRLVDVPGHQATFVLDAETLVGLLDDPLMDDVGDAVARDVARKSMLEVLAMRPSNDVADIDEDVAYGMGM